jgi:hypothetical protein
VDPLCGKGLHLVHDVATTVVPLARIAFGVLVGEDATHGLEHRNRREVLGRDEFDVPLLSGKLALDHTAQNRVDLRE